MRTLRNGQRGYVARTAVCEFKSWIFGKMFEKVAQTLYPGLGPGPPAPPQGGPGTLETHPDPHIPTHPHQTTLLSIFQLIFGNFSRHFPKFQTQNHKLPISQHSSVGHSGPFASHPPRRVSATRSNFSSNGQTPTFIKTSPPTKGGQGNIFQHYPIPP